MIVFPLFLLYVLVSYLYPAELFPALAPYRLTYWIGTIGLAAGVLTLIFRRAALATWQTRLLFAFTATMCLSLMIVNRWPGAPLVVFERFGPSLTMFLLAVSAVTSLSRLRIAAACLIVASLVLVVQGIAAYHFGYRPDLFLLQPNAQNESSVAPTDLESQSLGGSTDLDDGVDDVTGVPRLRGLGSLHDPNDLALAFVVAVGFLAGTWKRGAGVRNFLIAILPIAMLSYGVFLTHSRGGALALVVTLWLAARHQGAGWKANLLLVVLLLGVIAADFSGGRSMVSVNDESATGRVDAWAEGFEMLKLQPLLGIGYMQFMDYNPLTAHNSFVLCFAENGLIGYFFWLGLLLMTLVPLGKLKTPQGDVGGQRITKWASTLQLSLIAFLCGAFFLSRTYLPMLYLLVGMGAALLLLAKAENLEIWRPSAGRMSGLILASEVASIAAIYLFVKLHIA